LAQIPMTNDAQWIVHVYSLAYVEVPPCKRP
jgi:hypothetical protein